MARFRVYRSFNTLSSFFTSLASPHSGVSSIPITVSVVFLIAVPQPQLALHLFHETRALP